jgi:hypothetical protein
MNKLFTLLFLSSLPLIAQAGVYKCEENGKTIFTDKPCDQDAKPYQVTNPISASNQDGKPASQPRNKSHPGLITEEESIKETMRRVKEMKEQRNAKINANRQKELAKPQQLQEKHKVQQARFEAVNQQIQTMLDKLKTKYLGQASGKPIQDTQQIQTIKQSIRDNTTAHNSTMEMRHQFVENLLVGTEPLTGDDKVIEYLSANDALETIFYYPGFNISVYKLSSKTRKLTGGGQALITYPSITNGAVKTKCATDIPLQFVDWCFDKRDVADIESVDLPLIDPKAKHEHAKAGQACRMDTSNWPNDFIVMTGKGIPTTIDHQIDDDNSHESGQQDVIVNAPGKSVALMLNRYDPTLWNIQWTPGTRIVGVFVSGYHRQKVVGIDPSVPLNHSIFTDKNPCGRAGVTPKGDNYKAQYMSKNIFGKFIKKAYFSKKGKPLVLGEPYNPGEPLQTNPNNTAANWLKTRPIAGKPAIEKALAEGFIRRVTKGDVKRWTAARKTARENGQTVYGGQYIDTPKGGVERYGYMILKPYTIPANWRSIYGISFMLEKGVPFPKGSLWQLKLYDFNTLRCHGCP